MNKVDFVLTYEVKKREIEYLALLKCELEKRGYSTAIVAANAMWGWGVLYRAEVIISAGFTSARINSGNGVMFNKAIALIPEQIGNNGWMDTEKKTVDPVNDYVIFNAWGNEYKKFLMEKKSIPSSNVVVYGHPILDFCKDRFDNYYYSREELSKKYGFSENKQWNLFISSFGIEAIGEEGAKKQDVVNGNTRASRLYKNEVYTINELAEWFRKILDNYPEQIIIYRPHPVEKLAKQWRELEIQYENFIIVRDEGVRQWIKVCDRVYTWISTSSVEAFFMRKKFYLLRPYTFDVDIDLEIFDHSENAISSFPDFECSVLSDKMVDEFRVFDDNFCQCYHYNENEYTFEKLADLSEDVLRKDDYLIPWNIRQQIIQNNKSYWKAAGAKNRFKCRMRTLPIYEFYHDHYSPNVDYMNLRKGELEQIEERVKKCIQ